MSQGMPRVCSHGWNGTSMEWRLIEKIGEETGERRRGDALWQ